MMTLELAQVILRALGYTALAITAARIWARPYRPGVTPQEALAVAVRARRWALLATVGAATQLGRLCDVWPPIVNFTGTIVVFAVIGMGFLALQSGRRR